MSRGMKGRGFFAGAVGGLALALLLGGVVSFLPQSNTARQALYSQANDVGQGAGALASTTQPDAGAPNPPASRTSTTSPGPQAAGSIPARNSSQAPATSTTMVVAG